jgi:hypothetical protein
MMALLAAVGRLGAVAWTSKGALPMPSSNYNRRQFLGMAGAAAGAGLLGAYAAGTERPNILYIMADDHASHAISAYGK